MGQVHFEAKLEQLMFTIKNVNNFWLSLFNAMFIYIYGENIIFFTIFPKILKLNFK